MFQSMTNYGISIYFYVKIQQNTSYTSMSTSMDIYGVFFPTNSRISDISRITSTAGLNGRLAGLRIGFGDTPFSDDVVASWPGHEFFPRQNEAKWFFSWNSRLSPFFSEFPLYSLEVFSMPETSSFPWVNHEISGVDNFSLNFTLSNIVWLVEPTPLKNMSQLGLLFPIYGKKSKPPTSCPFLGDTWW